MDRTALAARLTEADLVGLPDWEAAATLNAPDPALPVARVDVPTADARELLLAAGAWPRIVMAAEPGSGAPADLRALCINVRDTLLHTETLRMSDPAMFAATEAALNGLVAAALVEQVTASAMLALAETHQSWAKANGIEVDARAVGLARGGR